MAQTSRRTVLTGIGLITSIGLSPEAYWDSLLHGRSGIRTLRSFDASGLPVRFGGEVPEFDAKEHLEKKERKQLRVMARPIQLAVSAAQLALDDGHVDKEKLDPTRFGVEFGSALISTELEELLEAARLCSNCQPGSVDLLKWGETGLPAITPLWMLKYLPNMLACHVSILHNAQGPNNTITENDVAGLLALGEAYRILSRDQADLFLVGGAESRLNPLSMSRQCLFETLSHRNDAPDRACRPFDRQRDGIVLGEGAGVFVVEDLEHARKRGARIMAEVVGFGAAFDPIDRDKGADYRSGAGLARAIRHALSEAGIGPDDVDHVNAHGFSTVASDAWEARGIREVFGNCKEPVQVLAVKSYFGSLGSGSGTAELAASVLALVHGQLPATLNYEEPDPACPVTVATGRPRPVRKPYVLKISCTQMGQCAAVVCRKWEG
jgi:3-oxoacyl-[acyl-carrier-protein] synthase II